MDLAGAFVVSVTPRGGETVMVAISPDEALQLRAALDGAIVEWLADLQSGPTNQVEKRQ